MASRSSRERQAEEVQKRLLAKLQESAKARKNGKPDAEQQKLRDEALVVDHGVHRQAHLPASFGTGTWTKTAHANERQRRRWKGWRMGVGGWICLAVSHSAWRLAGHGRDPCVHRRRRRIRRWRRRVRRRRRVLPEPAGRHVRRGGRHVDVRPLLRRPLVERLRWRRRGAAMAAGTSAARAVQDTGNFNEDNDTGGDFEGRRRRVAATVAAAVTSVAAAILAVAATSAVETSDPLSSQSARRNMKQASRRAGWETSPTGRSFWFSP